MPRIIIDLSKEEKKKLEIAKVKSDADTWREFFLNLIEDAPDKEKERKL